MSLDDGIRYATPTKSDLAGLLAMARRSFADSFADRFDVAPFAEFLDRSYAPDGRMARDFADPSIQWRIACEGPEIVGYAKVRPLMAPAPAPKPGALELQQIYLLERWKGRGVADRLMQWAIDTATRAAAPELYLTVFDHNLRARRFYARYGFEEVGRCTFTLGGQDHDDRIWRKVLDAHVGLVTT